LSINRTLLPGAVTVLLLASLSGWAPKVRADSIDDRLAKTEERKKPLDAAARELKALNKERPTGSRAYKAKFLDAYLTETRAGKVLDNQNYTAASKYRKLIALGGPGALEGKPRGGRWPDPYIEKAYASYSDLTARIDTANRKRTVYRVVDVLVKATGQNRNYSYWLAIVIITVFIKLLTTPLSHLQFESMRNMQRIQPKLEKLKREIGDNPQEYQRQQWQLMKDHNASPHWGCLALLVQMPFLLLIYHMIRAYEFQFARGGLLWIGSKLAEDLSFVAPSLADADWPLLLLYGLSMYFSTKMSSQPTDRQQAEQQKMMSILMPAMFVMIFNYFPSAFILYWLVLNLLTTTQQYFMLQKPIPALALEDEEDELVPQLASAGTGTTGGQRRDG